MEQEILKNLNEKIPENNIALFYEESEDKKSLLKSLFSMETGAKKKLIYICDDENQADISDFIKASLFEEEESIPEKKCKIWSAREVYLREGRFTLDAIESIFKKEVKKISEEGLEGLCLIVEVTSGLLKLFTHENVKRFQNGIRALVRDGKYSLVLEYDLSRLDSSSFINILSFHPLVFEFGSKTDNPYFISSEGKEKKDFISKIRLNRGLFDQIRKIEEMRKETEIRISRSELALKDKDEEIESLNKEVQRQKSEKGQAEKRLYDIKRELEEEKNDKKQIAFDKDDIEKDLKNKTEELEEIKRRENESRSKISGLEKELQEKTVIAGNYGVEIEKLNVLKASLKDRNSHLNQQIEEIKAEKNRISKLIEVKERNFEQINDELKTSLAEKEKQLSEFNDKLSTISQKYVNMETEFEKISSLLSSVETEKKELSAELEGTKEVINSLKLSMAEKENSIMSKDAEISGLEQLNEKLREELDEKNILVSSITAEREEKIADIERINEEIIAQMESERNLMAGKIERLQSALEQSESILNSKEIEFDRTLLELERMSGILEDRNGDIDRLKREANLKSDELKAYEELSQELKKKNKADSEENELKIMELEESHEIELKKFTGEINSLSEKLSEKQAENEKLKYRTEELENSCEAYEKNVLVLNDEITGLKDILNKAAEEKALLSGKLSELESLYDSICAEKDDTLSQIDSLNRACDGLKSDLNIVSGERESFATRLSELESLYDGVCAEKDDALSQIDSLNRACDGLRSDLNIVSGERESFATRLSELESLYDDAVSERDTTLLNFENEKIENRKTRNINDKLAEEINSVKEDNLKSKKEIEELKFSNIQNGSRITQLRNENVEKDLNLRKAYDELAVIKTDRDSLKSEIEKLTESVSIGVKSLSEMQKKNQNLIELLNDTEDKMNKLSKEHFAMKCHSAEVLKSNLQLQKERDSIITALKKAEESYKIEISKLNHVNIHVEEENKSLKEEIKYRDFTIDTFEKQLKASCESNDCAVEELEKLSRRYEILAEEKENVKKELDFSKNAILNFKKAFDSVKTEKNSIQLRFEELSEKEKKDSLFYSGKISELEKLISERDAEIEEFEECISGLKRDLANADKQFRSENEKVEFFRNALKKSEGERLILGKNFENQGKEIDTLVLRIKNLESLLGESEDETQKLSMKIVEMDHKNKKLLDTLFLKESELDKQIKTTAFLESERKKLTEDFENQVNVYTARIDQFERAIKISEHEKKMIIENSQNEAEKHISELDEIKGRFSSLESELREKEEIITQSKNKYVQKKDELEKLLHKKAEEEEKIRSKYRKLKEKAENLETDLSKSTLSIMELRNTNEKLVKRIRNAESEKSALNEKLCVLEKNVENNSAIMLENESEIERLLKTVEEKEAATDVLKTELEKIKFNEGKTDSGILEKNRIDMQLSKLYRRE